MAAALAILVEAEGGLSEALNGVVLQLIGAGAAHGSHEAVKDGGDDEDFLFTDAEQVMSKAPPTMMDLAAMSRSAVSSTTTGGLPGPAAMTRLPDLAATRTTPGPPVTQSSAMPGCWKTSSAALMLAFSVVVRTLATPSSRWIHG